MNARRTHPARGFSLFELLIVVAIIAILFAIIAPSVAELVKSNNYSSAINQLSGTLEAARQRAISRGKQTAVAVMFDVATKRTTLLILEEVSNRGDLARETNPQGQAATVFRPVRSSTPVELPEGVMIFGVSANHIPPDANTPEELYDSLFGGSARYESRAITRADALTDDEEGQITTAWYAGSIITNEAGDALVNPWLPPRNDPRVYVDAVLAGRDISGTIREPGQILFEDLWNIILDLDVETPGLVTDKADAVAYVRHAQTFMIRFSTTGSILTSDSDLDEQAQTDYAYLEYDAVPVASGDSIPDEMVGVAYDSPTRFDPETLPRDRSNLFDDPPPTFAFTSADANPEVVLRAASRLAVVDLQDLAAGAAVTRPWALHPALTDPDFQAPWPDEYLHSDGRRIANTDEDLNELVRDMSDWIDENAVIIDFSRFSGRALRR